MELLDRVKSLCKERNVSQGKMEKEIGISNGASSKWKNSSPSMEILQKLSSYFGVSVDYLMTGVQYEPHQATQIHTIAAHFDGDEYTEEELDKIKEFAAFVKNGRKK